MYIDYKIPENLPWIYKKHPTSTSIIPQIKVPNVEIGLIYYVNISKIGWSQAKIKSFVITDSNIFVIVIAPNGIEYAMHPNSVFCKTVEDVKSYVLGDYSKNIKCVAFNEKFFDIFSNCPFINKHKTAFEGYHYNNGYILQSKFLIKSLWIDDDGIHYEISSDIDELYPTKELALDLELKIVTFSDNNNEEKPLSKYLVTVEIYAENYDEAKKKVKIE